MQQQTQVDKFVEFCHAMAFANAADEILYGCHSPKQPYVLGARLCKAALRLVDESGGHIAAWGTLSRAASFFPRVNTALLDKAKRRASNLLNTYVKTEQPAWELFCCKDCFKQKTRHIENALTAAFFVLLIGPAKGKFFTAQVETHL